MAAGVGGHPAHAVCRGLTPRIQVASRRTPLAQPVPAGRAPLAGRGRREGGVAGVAGVAGVGGFGGVGVANGAVVVGALGTIGTGVAVAAPVTPAQAVVPVVPATTTAATTTSTPPAAATPAATTTDATTTAAPVAAGPPVLRNLKLPAKVTARQGHARFLLGVRVTTPSTLTAQVFAVKGDTLVRTVTADATTAGRVYMLIEATSEQRYQLPAGTYRIRLQASDAQSRKSNVMQKSIVLATTTPRGRLDMDTLPLWRPLARSLGIPARGGQLVTAVAPRGDSVKSGMRRGDVIVAINTDAEAPMVTKATYAVIGDMHEVVPAVVERLQGR